MPAREYKWREFGDRLKAARRRTELTQQRVADLLGVKAQTVWYWESGRSKPGYERLARLATLYNVSVETLIVDSAEMKNPNSVEWNFVEDQPADLDTSTTAPPDPEQSDIEADRELLMNEASLALRAVSDDLSDDAIHSIADFIRYVHARDEQLKRES